MDGLSKINSSTQKRAKILLAPLDWGLGHATRCIPIVKELLSLDCEVIIAATGGQKALLEEEFPRLPFVELPGYGVKYGKNRALTLLKIMAGIPKILIRIKAEKAWLAAFRERERPDAVISDNRYGLYHEGLPSVFITHQLRIRTPFGKGADGILQRLQYHLLKRFSICWVPDREKPYSLAGALSHPEKLPHIPVRYIGILSRFGPCAATDAGNTCDLLILLSGPEPQRTIFEKLILDQLTQYRQAGYLGKAVLVRGLPEKGRSADAATASPERNSSPLPTASPGLTIFNHLPAAALNALVCSAGRVLCRPGYSSVMDLMKLQKNCIFVPTPGQTEQEYLGAYLAERQQGICLSQAGFSLAAAITASEKRSFAKPAPESDRLYNDEPNSDEPYGDGPLRTAIKEFIGSLKYGRPGDPIGQVIRSTR